jgi:uncharacterized membrane protein YfhO
MRYNTNRLKSNKKPQISSTNTQKKTTPFQNFISDSNGLWVTISLTLLLLFLIFHKFIIGEAYYLFKDIGSDTMNSFYPHFVYVSKYLRTEGFPLWSFAQGMGQNIQSISVHDPFFFIIYYLFPSNVAYGIIWMEITKMTITAILFYLVFKYWEIAPVARLVGSLLVTFCGFMIVAGGWYLFSTEICSLGILLLGFEMLWKKKSWYLFPVGIALFAINQPFNLYLYGLFLIFYILFRFLSTQSANLKDFLKLSGKLLALSLLGLVISSFFFWSGMQQILDSPRVGGDFGYYNKLMAEPVFGLGNRIHNISSLMRFYSNDLLGIGSNFKGYINYLESPLFYIGLLPLLLMPQAFFLQNRKKAILSGISLALFLLPVIFPWFRHAFWLFTGDYNRGFSFFTAIVLLFLFLLALEEIIKGKQINLIVLYITAFFMLVFLNYPYKDIKVIIDDHIQSQVTIFIILYTIASTLIYFQSTKQYAIFALAIIAIFEIGFVNYKGVSERSVVSRSELGQKKGYNDYAVDAMNMVNQLDPGFFRVTKNYTSNPTAHSSFNDAKIQNYYGTMVYGSFNQKYYIRFMKELGIIEKNNETQSRWVIGFMRRPLLQTWASTKYKIIQGKPEVLDTIGYQPIKQFENVMLYKNKHALPLGFTYKYFIPADSFVKLSQIKQDIILLNAFVTEDPAHPDINSFTQFSFKDTAVRYGIKEYIHDINVLKKDTLSITYFSQNRIKGTIQSDSTRMLFLSIPYDKGWHAIVDGKQTEPMLCNIGFLGLILDAGKHEIELFYEPPFFRLSLYMTFVGIFVYLIAAALTIWIKKRENASDAG